jgi:UDP-N-acetylglucosamine 4-epimerase
MKYKILITGGAGFIGSNLVDHFLSLGHKVVCLDNLATGFKHNIEHHFDNESFRFIDGDIRSLEVCIEAVKDCDFVLHQAALGSVPRSINDPITSNDVNVGGFLNMLIAARDEGVSRFVYAASSSTYGDSKKLPKVEEEIGKPLSPYAITKYVNELYADVFAKTYNMQCIGLRYFNVFGRRQDPNGAYAAVIPLWVKSLLDHNSPVINGDGSYSRDFTFIDNVVEANEKAMFTSTKQIHIGRKQYYNMEFEKNRFGEDKEHIEYAENDSFSEVFNVAYGGNTNLIELFEALRSNLGIHDKEILKVNPIFGTNRPGDIPHSKASIEKARMILKYSPQYDATEGFQIATEWYYNNIK